MFNQTMDVHFVRLRGPVDLSSLAAAFERAGCATVPSGTELEVIVPVDRLGDDKRLREVRVFLHEWEAREDVDLEIVEQRVSVLEDAIFERLRALRGFSQ